MNDPALNDLLKWSIQNTEASRNDPNAKPAPKSVPNIEALQSLFGQTKSQAELMKEAMNTMLNKDGKSTLDDRLNAFDDFEQLIAQIDNANNMEPLGHWTPLVGFLENPEPGLRQRAALCCGTAAENNIKSQEKVGCIRPPWRGLHMLT